MGGIGDIYAVGRVGLSVALLLRNGWIDGVDKVRRVRLIAHVECELVRIPKQ